MKKYNLWFDFVNTEEEARALTEYKNRTATPYQRRRYPAHFTEWSPLTEEPDSAKFVVWSYYK